MIIKYAYYQDPVPTDYLIIVAYKPLLTGGFQEVNRAVYDPPHLNPADFVLSVPTPAVHLVRIYQSADGIALGTMRIEFVANPSLDGPTVPPPLTIKVGGGRAGRDPVDQANEVDIPSIATNGWVISWVEQRGAATLVGQDDSPDPEDLEWLPKITGGITLQNGKVFNENELYTIHFESVVEATVSDAIQDLTEVFEDHIQNTSNPHAVTKTQVGLGNIPNAISNSYQQNDPNKLATSKAVHDLWLANTRILLVGVQNIGTIPPNTGVEVTITHDLDLIPDSYIPIGTLGGYSGSYTSDNKVTYATSDTLEDSFKVGFHNNGSASANLVFFYIIVDKT
jgi:hypothetical protein